MCHLSVIPYTSFLKDVANGILGSLVAITAPCACTTPFEALIIGFIGSLCANSANHVLLGGPNDRKNDHGIKALNPNRMNDKDIHHHGSALAFEMSRNCLAK